MTWKTFCFHGIAAGDLARAKALGATHVGVGRLPAKPRHEKTDPTDPYLEYSFILGHLFRYIVPDELRSMTPAAYEKQTYASLQRECEALREHGLRGWIHLLEPHAWSDEIFEAHPDWRGPRVEFPPRAKKPYWAPCVDHPEVLAIYRQTIARLCSELPEIDTFRLITNDSGAGICWSAKLYSGTNGPTTCESRPYGQRVRDFLKAFIDGAADAGVKATVLLTPRGMSEEQAEAARLCQPEGGHVLPSPAGFANTSAGGGGPSGSVGIINPVAYVEGLSRCVDSDELSTSPRTEFDWRLLERFIEKPARTAVERAQMLTDLAAEIVGDEHAETLLGAWRTIHDALARIPHMPWGGLLFEHGLLSKRWITRPLVVFPEELTDDENADWLPFAWDGGNEGEKFNLCNVQATVMMEGVQLAYYHRRNCIAGCDELRGAADVLDDLSQHAAGNWPDELTLLAQRLRATACLYRTVGNAPMFQAYMDRVRESDAVGTDLTAFFCYGGPIRKVLNQLLRDEIENADRLAELIEANEQPVVAMSEDADAEDCFTLGPTLPDRLRRKAKIMRDHVMDVGRCFPFPQR